MSFTSKLSIDINEGEFKFLEWSTGLNKKIKLKRCMSLPVHGVQDDLNLKEVVKISGFKSRQALICISDQRVVTRIVKVPYMEEKDLASYVEMEIDDFLLVDLETFDYDYRVLKKFEEEDREYNNILLAGVPKSLIDDWLNVIHTANLYPLSIDIYPNAIARLFKEAKDVDAAVIDIGRNTTHFTVFEKGVLFLYACISGGHAGVTDTGGELPAVLEPVFNDIRAYLNFYSSRHYGQDVDEIYLMNDLFLVQGAGEMVSGILGREVICDIPAWCYTKIDRGEILGVIPAYAVNLGLIMRGMKL